MKYNKTNTIKIGTSSLGFVKVIAVLLSLTVLAFSFSGCAWVGDEFSEITGSIVGNTYNISFYSDDGIKFMDMSGDKIYMRSNMIRENTYNEEDGWGYTNTMSDVITVTIDGKEVENCGSTMIFAEDGLLPDLDFKSPDQVESNTDGNPMENTSIADGINKYKNLFGKSRVVIIQSQLGDPICAHSGDIVYWKVCQDLPETTKLMIDGKALYIHRANFQIIDKELLN